MPSNAEVPRFLSPGQVGKIVGRSEKWVQVLCGRGHLQAHRVGPRGTWQISPEELERAFGLTPAEVRKEFADLQLRTKRAGRVTTP